MKTKKTMLEYCKAVLDAVSFDQELYQKEYKKSLGWLSADESNELKQWAQTMSQPGLDNF